MLLSYPVLIKILYSYLLLFHLILYAFHLQRNVGMQVVLPGINFFESLHGEGSSIKSDSNEF